MYKYIYNIFIYLFIYLESGNLFRYGEYATGFTIVDSGFSSLQGRDFSTPRHSDLFWMPHGLSLDVMRRLRETNHTIPSGTEVKKSWRCTFTSPYLSINIDIDIFVDYNWVNTRWQYYSTHLHIKNIENNTVKQNTKNGTYITIGIHKYNNKNT